MPTTTNAPTRLLVAISVGSGLKAALIAAEAVAGSRADLPPPWGLPAGSWLPLTVLSCVLYAASGEAARRQAPGGLWFVLAVNVSGVLASAQRLGSVVDVVSLGLSAALIVAALVALGRSLTAGGPVAGSR